MRSDDVLLAAWAEGDTLAGDELVQRYFSRLYRFFSVRLGDEIDDLVQRTFLDCVASRDRIQEGGFRAYLFRVARNRLIDHLRHTLGQPEFDPHSSVLPDASATTPSLAVARQQEVRLLQRALRRLPLDQQITLGLYYWDGLTTPEIGIALDVSPHTVRSRLARARDGLRQHIESLAESPELSTSTIEGLEAWASKIGELARTRR